MGGLPKKKQKHLTQWLKRIVEELRRNRTKIKEFFLTGGFSGYLAAFSTILLIFTLFQQSKVLDQNSVALQQNQKSVQLDSSALEISKKSLDLSNFGISVADSSLAQGSAALDLTRQALEISKNANEMAGRSAGVQAEMSFRPYLQFEIDSIQVRVHDSVKISGRNITGIIDRIKAICLRAGIAIQDTDIDSVIYDTTRTRSYVNEVSYSMKNVGQSIAFHVSSCVFSSLSMYANAKFEGENYAMLYPGQTINTSIDFPGYDSTYYVHMFAYYEYHMPHSIVGEDSIIGYVRLATNLVHPRQQHLVLGVDEKRILGNKSDFIAVFDHPRYRVIQ